MVKRKIIFVHAYSHTHNLHILFFLKNLHIYTVKLHIHAHLHTFTHYTRIHAHFKHTHANCSHIHGYTHAHHKHIHGSMYTLTREHFTRSYKLSILIITPAPFRLNIIYTFLILWPWTSSCCLTTIFVMPRSLSWLNKFDFQGENHSNII